MDNFHVKKTEVQVRTQKTTTKDTTTSTTSLLDQSQNTESTAGPITGTQGQQLDQSEGRHLGDWVNLPLGTDQTTEANQPQVLNAQQTTERDGHHKFSLYIYIYMNNTHPANCHDGGPEQTRPPLHFKTAH